MNPPVFSLVAFAAAIGIALAALAFPSGRAAWVAYLAMMWGLLAATFALVPAFARLLGSDRRRAHCRPIRGRGVFIQPEVGLPPGFALPSVRLTPPASKPPMSVLMSRSGIAVLSHDWSVTPLGGVSMAEFAAGFATAFGGCAHPDAVPVNLPITGERVAWLCPNPKCDAQLPADWRQP